MKRRDILKGALVVSASGLLPKIAYAGGESYKVVIVGDGAVGKTSALISFTTNAFPGAHIPTVLDNTSMTMKVDGKSVRVGLWDTAGQETYDRLRPLSYPGTDLFIVGYSVISPSSFEQVRAKWLPEIRHHVPDAKILVAGLKTDLRPPPSARRPLGYLTTAAGKEFAKSLRLPYRECSALTQWGLKDLFETSVRVLRGSPLAPVQATPKTTIAVPAGTLKQAPRPSVKSRLRKRTKIGK